VAKAKKSSSASKSSRKKSNSASNPTPEELTKLYRDMLLIRRFEEKAGQLYGMGLIGGFCHLYIGQEAVVTGISSVQEKGDTVVTSYRDHAHMLACDMDPKGIMAELTGREGGYSRGKGGSMQSNQGQVAECYNMAALWDLPVLFVIENNQYGMGTSVKRSSAGTLYRRGEGYGIPGEQVDGMDVFAVQAAARQALDYVRSGSGPYILEVLTYRYRGHSMSDPAKYRTKDEVTDMKDNRDPIVQVKNMMQEMGIEESALKAIDKEIKDELWTDVLVEEAV